MHKQEEGIQNIVFSVTSSVLWNLNNGMVY